MFALPWKHAEAFCKAHVEVKSIDLDLVMLGSEAVANVANDEIIAQSSHSFKAKHKEGQLKCAECS